MALPFGSFYWLALSDAWSSVKENGDVLVFLRFSPGMEHGEVSAWSGQSKNKAQGARHTAQGDVGQLPPASLGHYAALSFVVLGRGTKNGARLPALPSRSSHLAYPS